MATVEDYVSGKVCHQLEKSFSIFDGAAGASLAGTRIGAIMLDSVQKLAPTKLTLDDAIELIESASRWAVGPRICMAVHTEAPLTKAVFLDELAEAMVKAGKAAPATRAEAVANLQKYRKHPIMVTRVSGKQAEICPAWAKKCLYWNMEKHRLKCVHR